MHRSSVPNRAANSSSPAIRSPLTDRTHATVARDPTQEHLANLRYRDRDTKGFTVGLEAQKFISKSMNLIQTLPRRAVISHGRLVVSRHISMAGSKLVLLIPYHTGSRLPGVGLQLQRYLLKAAIALMIELQQSKLHIKTTSNFTRISG